VCVCVWFVSYVMVKRSATKPTANPQHAIDSVVTMDSPRRRVQANGTLCRTCLEIFNTEESPKTLPINAHRTIEQNRWHHSNVAALSDAVEAGCVVCSAVVKQYSNIGTIRLLEGSLPVSFYSIYKSKSNDRYDQLTITLNIEDGKLGSDESGALLTFDVTSGKSYRNGYWQKPT
jgi:hypothetical protein